MIKTFCIDLFDGHLIFEDNGKKVLVDTGSPVTIGIDSCFTFMDQQHACHTSLMGKDISKISAMMGYDIDVLMGLDILCQYYIQTDYKSKEITFSTDEIPFESICSVPLSLQGGAVCIDLTVNGRNVKLALDTGAKISYINESYTRGKDVIETRTDFSPLINDSFTTPIYSMEAAVGDQTFIVNFGNLPSILEMSLKMMGILGAIGFDLFNTFTVLMDFHNQKLMLA